MTKFNKKKFVLPNIFFLIRTRLLSILKWIINYYENASLFLSKIFDLYLIK